MLREAKVLIERWREHYNRVRPHSSLGYRPPTPEAWMMHARSAAPDSSALRPALRTPEEAVSLTLSLDETVGAGHFRTLPHNAGAGVRSDRPCDLEGRSEARWQAGV